jgi:hypothetical protein
LAKSLKKQEILNEEKSPIESTIFEKSYVVNEEIESSFGQFGWRVTVDLVKHLGKLKSDLTNNALLIFAQFHEVYLTFARVVLAIPVEDVIYGRCWYAAKQQGLSIEFSMAFQKPMSHTREIRVMAFLWLQMQMLKHCQHVFPILHE